MELWTEYEGRTIDGAFPLKKLLLPEGRSAFFSTSNGNGDPTVIRLIASHFDEEEILARWRGVEALHHPNILKLERYGQLTLDDTTVVYAVIEPVDANLAEVIADQRLTLSEARQLAASLASALDVLHANGFVHEHVEPSNIFAVGETVKLRGDCIRETPEGPAGKEARVRDIHNLAVILLQSLTQKRTLEAGFRDAPLPAEFEQIVRNGLNGTWGLKEIAAALKPADAVHIAATPAPPARPTAPAKPAAGPTLVTPPPASSNGHHAAGERKVSESKPVELKALDSKLSASPAHAPARETAPASAQDGTEGLEAAAAQTSFRSTRASEASLDDEPEPRRSVNWIPIAAGLIIVALFLVWFVGHRRQSSPPPHPSHRRPPLIFPRRPRPPRQHPPAPTLPPPAQGCPLGHSTAAPTSAAAAAPPDRSPDRPWRVICYTYNGRDNAQRKADTIAAKHPDLHPVVFTPTGRAPFLITVGGPMTRDAAYAFARRAGRLRPPPRHLRAKLRG